MTPPAQRLNRRIIEPGDHCEALQRRSCKATMEEVSLDDLLGQLASAQQEKPKVRLSERNVVELVGKLQAAGLLGPDLLHSINGREYLTQDHLRSEVRAAVESAGGRIPVVDLPALLGVDLVHCERQAGEAVAASGGELQLVQGELITVSYFDALAAEVADSLQEAGALHIGDIAQRTRLGVDLLVPVLQQRLGSVIPGKLEGGLLYTDTHIARIRARVRGAVRGALSPLSVPALAKSLALQGGGSAGRSLGAVLEELAAAGEVAGELRGGGGGTWIPAVHARAQQNAVLNFFRQNRVMEYTAVSRMGHSNPQAHLQAAFPDGVALQHCFVGSEFIAQLDAAAEEALAAGTWVDVGPLLPAALPAEDAAELLQRCPSVLRTTGAKPSSRACDNSSGGSGGRGAVLCGTCIASGQLVAELAEQLKPEARAAAERQLQQQKAAAKAKPQTPASGKKGGPGPAAASLSPAGAAEADSDDDWGRGAKGGKGKGSKVKGGKKKGGAKATPPPSVTKQQPGSAAGKGGKGGDATSAAAVALSISTIAAKILEWQPAMEDSGKLARELAEQLRPTAIAEFEAAVSAVFAAGAEARRRAREAAGVALRDAFTRLQLLAHGAEAVAGDDTDLAGILQKHLLRGAGAEAVDALLRFHETDLQRDGDAAPDSTAAATPQPLTSAERAGLLQQLPPDVAPSATDAVAALADTNAQALLDAVEAAAEAGGQRLRRLDKKAERREVHNHVKALEEALEREEAPPAALSLAVPLLAAKVWGRAVSLPGRALSPVIERLKGAGMVEADAAALADFQSKVVASLSGGGDAEEVGQQLAVALPGLKHLAGIGVSGGTGGSGSRLSGGDAAVAASGTAATAADEPAGSL